MKDYDGLIATFCI